MGRVSKLIKISKTERVKILCHDKSSSSRKRKGKKIAIAYAGVKSYTLGSVIEPRRYSVVRYRDKTYGCTCLTSLFRKYKRCKHITAFCIYEQRLKEEKNAISTNFWGKVEKTDSCWLWTASTKNNGYGQFYINRKPQYAHRVAWELSHGSIPKGKLVCHKCDNPKCVRPAHLFIGTQMDNVKDCIKKGRKRTKPVIRTKESIKEDHKKWREQNKEKIKTQSRKAYLKHKKKIQAYQKERYRKNKDEINSKARDKYREKRRRDARRNEV